MQQGTGVYDEQVWWRGFKWWLLSAGISLSLFAIDRINPSGILRARLEQIVQWVQKPGLWTKEMMSQPARWWWEGRNAAARLADVEERLAQMAVDKVKLNTLENQVIEMEQILQTIPRGKKATQLAELYQIQDRLLLAAGEADGIKVGEYVTDRHSVLVGKIVTVGRYTSRIMPPGEDGFRLSVKTESGEAKGILERNGSQLLMTNTLQTESLTVGDILVTSGAEEQLPPGIVVGQINQLLGTPSDPTKGAVVSLLSENQGWGAVW